ncbi:Phospholipase/Carboxylesterase family protein [Coccidioides posadasii C735 delta SOWgp]|uniref:Acyl-protein thioesterase 1 n=1 Tax=Coccidioides posadasii (strain C735) TaxID=222929 RepID=C5NZH1_COCP7|nr:Phospholipase/Carboxylesterase family protein [Coccidioides posadasii C735 delta SOWgp]EER29864.1 Phospholipase/Carboxylesterase family protein [Coccidioides posadasii C735 delta SOWgp]|eukprot:XP_003072009.1 Phospholipase/Carboxylesterase family protein [Coccidioides posadasii C735 delta SOWgp]
MVTAPFVVPALKKHTATVIMAHGLGDEMMLARNWRRRGMFDEVSFIFPNAPSIPITVNFGMTMPAWYDIATLSVTKTKMQATEEEFLRQQDEPGILRSRDYFNSLIKEEMDKGIKPSRIVLGGFSQGGAMSLITGLTCKEKLGGIFALSCYLPLSNKIKELLPENWPNEKTPVFMAHGNADSVVKFEFGQSSAKHLKEMGMEVDFNEYPGMGHSGDPLEIQDLEKFLAKVIPPESKEASPGL